MKEKIFIGISIGMVLSLCSGSYKISGIGLLVWVIYTFYMVSCVFKRNKFTLKDFDNEVSLKFEKAYEDKKYTRMVVYSIVTLMMGLGIVTVSWILICMIFLL